MKVLITGIGGFVGSHLAEYALEKGAEVFGIDKEGAPLFNIADILERIKYFSCNLHEEGEKLSFIIKEIVPHWIFHLAATREGNVFEVNVGGCINLLNSLVSCGSSSKVLIVGSSAQYGMVYEGENPIKETNPFRPLNFYGISKCAQEMVAQMYFLNQRMHIIRVRAFNIIGPRLSDAFAPSSFAHQIARIEKGRQEPIIYVGNLSNSRDYIDIKDVVKAYWLLLEKEVAPDVYNVCSGRAWTTKDILNYLISLSPEKNRIKIKIEERRMRIGDVPLQIGDASKIKKACGWSATIDIEKSLLDLLNFWRKKEERHGMEE